MRTTITYKGVDFQVEYDYYPEEPMVMYYPDGSGSPGYPAYAEILNIHHCDTDFFELLEDHLEEIERIILRGETD